MQFLIHFVSSIVAAALAAVHHPVPTPATAATTTWTECSAPVNDYVECDPWSTTGPRDHVFLDAAVGQNVVFHFSSSPSGNPYMTVIEGKENGWLCTSGPTSGLCEYPLTASDTARTDLQLPGLLCPNDPAGECPDGEGANAKSDEIISCFCGSWGSLGTVCNAFCCANNGSHC